MAHIKGTQSKQIRRPHSRWVTPECLRSGARSFQAHSLACFALLAPSGAKRSRLSWRPSRFARSSPSL